MKTDIVTEDEQEDFSELEEDMATDDVEEETEDIKDDD